MALCTVGVIGLGESMPATLQGKMVRLTSWTLILVGVTMIAYGPGIEQWCVACRLGVRMVHAHTEGLRVVAGTLASMFPRGVLNQLPTPVAVKLRQAAQKLELPTHAK